MREVIKIGDTSFNLMTTSIDATTWRLMYHQGIKEANYPVPAIIYEAVFPWEQAGYVDLIYVNDLSCGEDDPVLVCCWDFHWNDKWWGVYQHCYNDHDSAWYRCFGAWHD